MNPSRSSHLSPIPWPPPTENQQLTTNNPNLPPRSCGTCSLCCQAPAIPGLAKPAGVPCDLLTKDHAACSVWHHRSAPEFNDCRTFRCLWLDGAFTDSDRPDRLGVFFAAKPDPDKPGQLRIQVAEAAPGNAYAPRPQQLIAQILAKNQTVAITNPNYVLAILPTGDSWHYQIDPADPLHSKIDPAVAPLRLTIHGRPVQSSSPIPPSATPPPATAAPAESSPPTRQC